MGTIWIPMVAIDTNSVIFLYEATDGNYDPIKDKDSKKAPERLAIFRIFIYTKWIKIPPTAKKEIERPNQHTFCLTCLQDIPPHNINDNKVNILTTRYLKSHPSPNDCKILAEATVGDCECLLSYDKDLIKNLKGEAKIEIMSPSEFWNKNAPPKNSKPILQAPWPNPKVTQDWYKW